MRSVLSTTAAVAVAIVVVVVVVVSDTFPRTTAAAFAPNHFLGTCLDAAWVARMETALGVSASDRDALGRLQHPFLHRALQHTCFHVRDPRMALPHNIYATADLPHNAVIYGDGARVDPTNAARVLDKGVVNGSLVLELSGWTSHSLTTLVFSILVREIYGYPVSHYYVTNTRAITERMSSVRTGRTTPTHANLEVWIAGIQYGLQVYANESFSAGGVGYFGRSGLYTSVDFMHDALPLFANFWQSYVVHDQLLRAVPVSKLRENTAFFPPSANSMGCANGSMGCRHHCAKTYACTLREEQRSPPHDECAVVVMMYDYYDPGFLQAVLDNLDVATYFCFLGYDGAQQFVLDAQRRRQPVLFYHFEPDLFHVHHNGLFDRVFLPRSRPERVALATGTFGENGYGNRTTNPVDVDFPTTRLTKYAATVLQSDVALTRLLSQFTLSELDINDLLRKYATASNSTTPTTTNSLPAEQSDPTFRAACDWVQQNYAVWSLWLERLPLCSFASHMAYDIRGCDHEGEDDEEEQDEDGSRMRVISFRWRQPHPDNASHPYTCDGGMMGLPAEIYTSRDCDWLQSDASRWASWVDGKPECDSKFFTYTISPCDDSAQRLVAYAWLLPHPTDASTSLECEGGDLLPLALEEACDYMPYASPQFLLIATADGVLTALLLAAMLFVRVHRHAAVVKRAPYALLQLTLTGGVLMCGAVVAYAGAPSRLLCGARPVLLSLGFTTVFGALLAKSLRVHRCVLLHAAVPTKRTSEQLPSTTLGLLREFMGIVVVDVLLLVAWFTTDFPEPTTTLRRASHFDGSVTDRVCASTSLLFTGVFFFWKATLLLVGSYMAFVVLHVAIDFQDAFWTFGACLIVLVGSVVLMPLAYIVDLPPSTFYVVLAWIVLACTALVMACLLVPKLWRFRSASAISGIASGSGGSMLESLSAVSAHSQSRDSLDFGHDGITQEMHHFVTPVVAISPAGPSVRVPVSALRATPRTRSPSPVPVMASCIQ